MNPFPAPRPARKRHSARNVFLAAAGLMILLIILIATGSRQHENPATSSSTSTASAPSPAAVAPAAQTSGTTMGADGADGIYVVGRDIRPGVYHTAGLASGSTDCYFALLSSTNTNDIIDNDNLTGPGTITVSRHVKAVEVSGCQVWTRIGG